MTKSTYDTNMSKLQLWARAYYEDDNPIATDEEYDSLYKLVKEYENTTKVTPPRNSPTINIGAEAKSSVMKSNHLSQMWSQKDIFDTTELKKWLNSRKTPSNTMSYLCEPKYDGASLNLIYEHGVLQKAITRGNGLIGEDVTSNASVINSIPQTIKYKELIEIRGEIIIKKSDFDIINAQRMKLGESLFANPRNAASGSLRHQDITIVSQRKLYFQVWGVGKNTLINSTNSDLMEFIYSQGFNRPPINKVCKTLQEIEDIYHEMIDKRSNIDIGLDGMVIKINSISDQRVLGYGTKAPKWSCAYKFPATEKITTIKDIKLQIGRTGIITPVAILDSVHIDGSNISKATLHNFDEIDRLDLRLNDKVILIKSGDIIPKITKVLHDRRDGNEIKFKIPEECPNCNKNIHKDGALLKCKNIECSSVLSSKIVHLVSKDCLDIKGLGPKTIELLLSRNIITSVLDLFRLNKNDSRLYEYTNHEEIINNIKAIKGIELHRFIYSLGIDLCGQHMSKMIAKNFPNDFMNLTTTQLQSLDKVKYSSINSYIAFMNENIDFVNKLFNIIKPTSRINKVPSNNHFLNTNVVITGTLSIGRSAIKEELESYGATVSSSVSTNTDYLIYGNNSGSKYEKAISLGIKTINELEYKELVLI